MKTILCLIVSAGCLLGFVGCAHDRETMTTTNSTTSTHSEMSAHPTGTAPTSGYGSGGSRGY